MLIFFIILAVVALFAVLIFFLAARSSEQRNKITKSGTATNKYYSHSNFYELNSGTAASSSQGGHELMRTYSDIHHHPGTEDENRILSDSTDLHRNDLDQPDLTDSGNDGGDSGDGGDGGGGGD